MDHKGLRALLVIHGVITMAAGIVLTVAPGLIPSNPASAACASA